MQKRVSGPGQGLPVLYGHCEGRREVWRQQDLYEPDLRRPHPPVPTHQVSGEYSASRGQTRGVQHQRGKLYVRNILESLLVTPDFF